ncbi:MAG TPA: hypothetical protein VKR06_30965, partial [Ktedonosporobacter sp.]|nr:hypothetical protein [Ktedonosporobacter sp.]
MKNTCLFAVHALLLILLLAACGPASTQARPQPTVTINPSFQAQLTQVPAAPAYRCGAWSSNNAPGAYSSI